MDFDPHDYAQADNAPPVRVYLNLTNGVAACRCYDPGAYAPSILRIQSTVCEQKMWDTLVLQTSDDFFYHLANNGYVEVHDVSERDRLTRALWQGLPALAYMAERAWTGRVPRPFIMSRDGSKTTSVGDYWDKVWHRIKPATIKKLNYYGRFYDRYGGATLVAVDCRDGKRVTVPWNKTSN